MHLLDFSASLQYHSLLLIGAYLGRWPVLSWVVVPGLYLG